MRDAGYTIALDDFTTIEGHEELLECADIVKVDFRLVQPEQRRELADYFRNKKIRLLGEKVETYEDFRQAQDAGYALFQGYFFAKPEVLNWEVIDAKGKLLDRNALVDAHLASIDWARAACNTQYESRRPSVPVAPKAC